MTVQVAILLFVVFLNVFMGLSVLQRSPKTRSLQLFFAMSVFISLWAITNYYTENATQLEINTLANRLAYLFGFLAVFSFLMFSLYFPKRLNTSWLLTVGLYVFGVIGALLSVTDLVVGGVYYNDAGEVAFTNGPALFGYIITLLIMGLFIARNYIRVYRYSSGREKHQSKLIIVGFLVMFFLIMFTNAIIPFFVSSWAFAQFAPFATLILIGSVTYAIAKYGLFDIRPVIARSIAYVAALFIIVLSFASIIYYTAQGVLGLELTARHELILAIFITASVVIFQPVKAIFDKLTNAIFYRDSYDTQKFLNDINTRIATTADIERLLADISAQIDHTLKAGFCEFYLEPQSTIELHLAGSNKWLFAHKDWTRLSQVLKENQEPLISTEDIYVADHIKDLMHRTGVDLIIKMTSNKQDVGYMLVGQKKRGDVYSVADIQVLNITADEVALAVQSALRFKEIERFNETLQQRIDDATRELKKTNQKLRTLDETKDEFISMASHQLRTPLTSIKGYLSMLLEGDVGELTEQQRTFLNQAYTSSQRMVYLIADLLNVSRLRTGKFVIERTDVYLPDIVNAEIEQLQSTADSRELKLRANIPDEFPMLMLDETKTRQVVMNFMDNAIYYTPKGGTITVELKAATHSVHFSVKDNGIGVPKPEQHLLFTKFYRAANARKARPDGTGLGLYMAKKVITAQGGAIIFKSKEGKGSTFGFSFPYAMLEPDNKPQQKTT